MKNIVYIGNYMLNDIIDLRNNNKVFSQAAKNKMDLIYKSLKKNNCNVNILSNGWMNNKSFKKHKGFTSDLNKDVYYIEIFDFPIFNMISSIYYGYKKVKNIHYNNKIDSIIFYNYRPETAVIAYLANRHLNIPIIVEYEDGYYNLKDIGVIKRSIINITEEIVSKSIKGSILVTSELRKRVKGCSVIVRGICNDEIITRAKKNKKNNSIPIVMYSGGLEEIRGVKVLLESLKYTHSKFKLIITGRGECEDYIKSNKDSRIEFLGYISYNEVVDNMINADILVNCQLERNSFGIASFPSKIFDYASTGNLILSSNNSDIEEFMGSCVSIYYNDNPHELAEKLDELLKSLKTNKYLEMKNKIDEFRSNNLSKEIGNKILDTLL